MTLIIVLLSSFFMFFSQGFCQSPSGDDAMSPRFSQSKTELIMSWLEPLKEDKASSKEKTYVLKWSSYLNNTWMPAKVVTQTNKMFANSADTPSVQCLNEKVCFAHWLEKSGEQTYAYDAIIAISQDAGLTWKKMGSLRGVRRQKVENYDGFLSFVPEGNVLRVFWVDGSLDDGKEHRMQLSTAELTTEGLINKKVVDASICSCCNTTAARTSEGPVVVYRGRRENEIRDIHLARLDQKGWSKPIAINHDEWQISGCPVNGPQIAVKDNNLAIAWYTAPRGTGLVRLVWSQNNGRTFTKPIPISEPEGALGHVNLTMLSSKTAIVLWIGHTKDPKKDKLLLRQVNEDGLVGDIYPVLEFDSSWKLGFPQLAVLGDQLLVGWAQKIPKENGQKINSGIQLTSIPINKIPQPSHKTLETLTPENFKDRNTKLNLSEFSFEKVSGQSVRLSDLKAKVILVSLWATWCEPCRSEQKELVQIYKKYKNRGLEIVAINQDNPIEKDLIEQFIKNIHLDYQVWTDPKGVAKSLFSTTAIPTAYLLSSDGTVLDMKTGFQKDLNMQLEKELSVLL